MNELPNLQYPIGECPHPDMLSPEERSTAIAILADLPEHLSAVLEGFTDAEFDTPYRPGAWTIRQLIHHIADSHLTAYTWMRLALTAPAGEWPSVFDYDPAALAELPDSTLPAAVSLQLLSAVHQRWVSTLRDIDESVWTTRGYTHPETGRCALEQALAMYAWHSRHHLAHILNCRGLHGW
jgi:hypothetical protein